MSCFFVDEFKKFKVAVSGVIALVFCNCSQENQFVDPFPDSSSAEHEALTKRAWSQFDRREYSETIILADKCIKIYQPVADRLQSQLAGSPLPKVSSYSPADRRAIFARGPLNDVAACMFMKARSLENLGRIADARVVYVELAKYTHAAVYDPQGSWFWHPAQEADDFLIRAGGE